MENREILWLFPARGARVNRGARSFKEPCWVIRYVQGFHAMRVQSGYALQTTSLTGTSTRPPVSYATNLSATSFFIV